MSRPGVLRDPGFRRFWTAQGVADTGSAALMIALPVLVVAEMGVSDAQWSVLNAVRWVPYVLLGLVIGALVDRQRRRPVMVGTDVARGLLLLAIPLQWWAGVLSMWSLSAVLLAFGAAMLVNDAASQSFVPRLVPRDRLLDANARLDQAGMVADQLGRSVGGLIAQAVAAAAAVLASAVGYLASAVLVWRVRTAEPPPARDRLRLRGVLADAAEGLRWSYGHRMLRPLSMSTHLWFVCQGIAMTVLPLMLLARDTSGAGTGGSSLGLDAWQFALVGMVGALSALLGAFGAGLLGRSWGAGPAVASCRGLTAVAWAVVAMTPDPGPGAPGWSGVAWVTLGVLAVAMAVNGVAMGLENPNEMAFRQGITPDRLQGRVNSVLRSVNRAALLAGILLAGLVVVPLAGGYRGAMWVAAVGFAVAAAGLALSPFRRARH